MPNWNLQIFHYIYTNLVLLSTLSVYLDSFCSQKVCITLYWKIWSRLMWMVFLSFCLNVQISLLYRRMGRSSALYYVSNWLQHVTRMNNNRIPNIILKYRPNWWRRLGRRLKRLLDKAENNSIKAYFVTDDDDKDDNDNDDTRIWPLTFPRLTGKQRQILCQYTE